MAAYAQNTAPVNAPNVSQEQIDQANTRAGVIKDQQDKMGLGLYRETMVKRTAFAMAQLANIQARMQRYLEKAKARGTDISAATAELAAIDEAMVTARLKLDALKEAVAESNTVGPENQEFFNVIINSLRKDTQDSLKTVKDRMTEVLSTLKTYRN